MEGQKGFSSTFQHFSEWTGYGWERMESCLAQRGVFVFLRSIAQRWRSERQFMSHKGQGFLIHSGSLEQLCAGAGGDGSTERLRRAEGVRTIITVLWSTQVKMAKRREENNLFLPQWAGCRVHVCCDSTICVIYGGVFLIIWCPSVGLSFLKYTDKQFGVETSLIQKLKNEEMAICV